MRRVLVLILITCCSFFISCSNKNASTTKNNVENVISDSIWHIHLPEDGDQKIVTSRIAKRVEYIPLETKKESFFRLGALRICIEDTLIVYSDRQRVLLFNRNGSFIRKIGKTGNGPGEFKYISHIVFREDTLFIGSTHSKLIAKYTFDGIYHGSIKPKEKLRFVKLMPDGDIACYDQINGNIVFYDRNWHPTDTLSVDQNVSSRVRSRFRIPVPLTGNYLFRFRDKLLFTNNINDTIWDVTDKVKHPILITDLKERLLPTLDPKEVSTEAFREFSENMKNYERVHFAISDTLVFFYRMTYDDKESSCYVFNITTQAIQHSQDWVIYDDIHGGVKLGIFHLIDNKIISFVDYKDIQKQYEKAEDEQTKLFWAGLKEKVNDVNDNPVLVIVELK